MTLALSPTRLAVSASALVLALFSTAAAQQQPSPKTQPPAAAAPSSIPVRAASEKAAMGEEVFNEHGKLNGAFFIENRVCTVRGCRSFVFDKRSGALIKNDRTWSEAYAPTGRGKQVIRMKEFTERERPKPAPSDKALERAPAISAVKRPRPESADREK